MLIHFCNARVVYETNSIITIHAGINKLIIKLVLTPPKIFKITF